MISKDSHAGSVVLFKKNIQQVGTLLSLTERCCLILPFFPFFLFGVVCWSVQCVSRRRQNIKRCALTPMILIKTIQIHRKDTILMQRHNKLLSALSSFQTEAVMCFTHSSELSEEILSQREQMFYRCLTAACAAFESLKRDGWEAGL